MLRFALNLSYILIVFGFYLDLFRVVYGHGKAQPPVAS